MPRQTRYKLIQALEMAKNKIAADLTAIREPAVQYFIEKCLPSYELTLDELN